MKIVKVSNFDDDCVNDILVIEKVPEEYAFDIADTLNEKFSTEVSRYWFRAVADDYQLHIWEP